MLSQVGWVLFHVDHLASVLKWIIWEAFWCSNVNTLISVESLGEVITVNDTEDSFVDIKVHSKLEIWPVIIDVAVWLWKLMSLKENSLWDSRVLNLWLNDVEGIIIQVEVDDALSDTVVLVLVLNNWLKEVGFEVEDLKSKRVMRIELKKLSRD